MTSTVFVTGASGYLGRATADALERTGRLAVVRGARRPIPPGTTGRWALHGDLAAPEGWESILGGASVVIHFAGRAHVPETEAGAAEAQRVNAEGTANVARAAAAAGARRFVLISSALVCGPASPKGRAFTEADAPQPATAYARSKWDAEQRLQAIATASGMEWIALRPPMVYGPGSPGNFHRLARLVGRGLPLPLARATAAKTFVSVANLVSAVAHVIEHPAAGNQALLVCDDETTSTAGLVRQMAAQLRKPLRLLPVPEMLLRAGGRLSGREADVARLLEAEDDDRLAAAADARAGDRRCARLRAH